MSGQQQAMPMKSRLALAYFCRVSIASAMLRARARRSARLARRAASETHPESSAPQDSRRGRGHRLPSWRGLDRSQISELMTCALVSSREHRILTGATGTGKAHLVCAFGGQVARHGLTVRYHRTHQLLEDLAVAHQDGTIGKARTACPASIFLFLTTSVSRR